LQVPALQVPAWAELSAEGEPIFPAADATDSVAGQREVVARRASRVEAFRRPVLMGRVVARPALRERSVAPYWAELSPLAAGLGALEPDARAQAVKGLLTSRQGDWVQKRSVELVQAVAWLGDPVRLQRDGWSPYCEREPPADYASAAERQDGRRDRPQQAC